VSFTAPLAVPGSNQTFKKLDSGAEDLQSQDEKMYSKRIGPRVQPHPVKILLEKTRIEGREKASKNQNTFFELIPRIDGYVHCVVRVGNSHLH
jgi:hypothetical protein